MITIKMHIEQIQIFELHYNHIHYAAIAGLTEVITLRVWHSHVLCLTPYHTGMHTITTM